MTWFLKLKMENKLAFIGLIIAILSFLYTIYYNQSIETKNIDDNKTIYNVSGNHNNIIDANKGEINVFK